jgi:hypothetical protein
MVGRGVLVSSGVTAAGDVVWADGVEQPIATIHGAMTNRTGDRRGNRVTASGRYHRSREQHRRFRFSARRISAGKGQFVAAEQSSDWQPQ